MVTGPGRNEVVEVPDPSVGPKDLLLKMKACGICGSDALYTAVGGIPPRAGATPLGHEPAGEVIEVGAEVIGVKVGDHVIPNPMAAPTGIIGSGGAYGGLADYLLIENAEPGDTLKVTLYWQAKAEMDTSYTVFVHLVGDGGAIRAQQDSIPHNGEWPTTGWVSGEVIADECELVIAPDTPPGTYHLIAGMYKADTGQRLTATAGNNNPLGDSVPLTEIKIN